MQPTMLEHIFLVYLARYRRKLDESDAQASWDQAIYKMSTYITLALAVGILFLTFAWTILTGIGSTSDHKTAAKIMMFIGVPLTIYWMRLHFHKYLETPPSSSPAVESREDRRLIRIFQFGTVGLFIFVCVAGYVLHEAGFRVV